MVQYNKDEIIRVCQESATMSLAASKLGMTGSTFKRIAKKLGCYKPNPGGKGTRKPKRVDGKNKYLLKDILAGKYPHYQTSKLHVRLIAEGIKKERCERCGIIEWNGKSISFELHHKDGDRTNHKLKNLIIECPNCHSQEEVHKRGGKIMVA